MRNALRALVLLGVLAVEGLIGRTYYERGTWWHFLLHQDIGWGLGLSAAAMAGALLTRSVPPLPSMLVGQLVSIVPDLMFRFLRMPHTASMDWWVGHISIHRGPSPLIVATAVLVLGGWSWFLALGQKPRRAIVVALIGPWLILVSCLVATPVPTTLSGYAADGATSPG